MSAIAADAVGPSTMYESAAPALGGAEDAAPSERQFEKLLSQPVQPADGRQQADGDHPASCPPPPDITPASQRATEEKADPAERPGQEATDAALASVLIAPVTPLPELPATVEDDIESFNAAEPPQEEIAPASGPTGRSSGEAVPAMEPAAPTAAVALDTEPAKETATAGDSDNALLPAAATGTAVAGEPLQQIGEAAAAVPPDDDLADDKPEEASPPSRDGERAVDGQAALVDSAVAPPLDGASNGPSDTASQPAGNAPTGSAPTAPPVSPSYGPQRLPPHWPLAAESQPSTEPRAITVDAARLIHRVARAFAAAGEVGGEVRLRLSPPELGALRLDVRVQEGALVARLETETATARTAIIDNLPALRDRLAEHGVRIERFDVDLMQRQPGGTPDRPADHRPPEQSVPPAVARGRRFPQVAEGLVAPSRRPVELDPRRINIVI